MSIFKFLVCCKIAGAANSDDTPAIRLITIKKLVTKKAVSSIPTSTKPIPQSVAMLDHASISIYCPIDSFTINDNFEKVNLASPIVFSAPPRKARKALASPSDDQHEARYALAVAGSSFDNENDLSYASSPCSTTPSVLFEQSSRINSFNTVASSVNNEDDEQHNIVYAPTTVAPEDEAAQRAMEHQRGNVEYQNLHREDALAMLEGTIPQLNDPLDSELMDTLAVFLGHKL
ncbi:unnamed protein product [Aureobasidium uvarum]|uniref:Uncharacterized protein n=1 Tax=Aureobasidium uvarum TaxID=2773716 RepID=A0A9N8KK11_9PEZI|nr:unnamed protein product [Aureobasidium uvarum]